MELDLKTLAVAVVVLVGVGYGVGRYMQPAEVKTEVREVVKEVERVKNNIVTVVKETQNKDGTVTKETVITDKTTIDSETEKSLEQIKTVLNVKPQYRVRAEVGYDFAQKNPQYTVGAEKRFWGPLSLGLSGTVDPSYKFKAANVTASWEF